MRRIGYFDGLRGLAAMQVLGEHYSSNFTGSSWHWAHLLTASDAAVFLFFLMSGFVLTPSFQKTPNEFTLNMEKRVIRLGLPAVAALIIALLFHAIAPNAAAESAVLSHSTGMLEQTRQLTHVSWSNYLADTLGATLFGGYKETGLLLPLANDMPSIYTSLNPPTWSLHVELWGSAVVLLLVWASTQSRLVYLSIATCAIAVIGINPLILFLIGHLCARALDTQLFEKYGTKIATQLFAALLVVIGAALCSDVSLRGVWLPQRLLDHGLLHTYYWFWWPREFGAILLFVGILLSPLIHTCLSWRLPRYLGRMSFPVYLLHWPIMMVVGASVYIWLHPFGARVAAAGALIVGLALTFALAELFERWCDQPAVALGRSFGRAQKTAVPAAL